MTSWPRAVPRVWLKHAVGLLVTAGCLALLFRVVDLTEALGAFAKFNWIYLVFGVASLAIGYAVRIARWSILLQASGFKVSFAACSGPFLGSIALNNVFPLRLGDLVRALVFPRSLGVSRAIATSSLVFERLVDLVSLLAFLGFALAITQAVVIPTEFRAVVLGLSVVGAGTFVVGILFSDRLSRLFCRAGRAASVPRRLRCAFTTTSDFFHGFRSMSRPGLLVRMLLFSVLAWLGEAGLFYSVLLGAGIDTSIPTALVVMSLTTLSTLVPSSPGYIGTFHLAAFTAVSLFHGPTAEAGSYALIVHLALWIPTTVAGLLAMWMVPGLFRAVKTEAAGI